MNPEAKASVMRNFGFLVNAAIIVIAVVLADLAFVSWTVAEIVILLMCFFIVVEVLKQAYMGKLIKNRKKIRDIMVIGTVFLLLLVIVVALILF